jgi:hypothetical protein
MTRATLLMVLFVALYSPLFARGQGKAASLDEQTHFSVEQEIVPVQRPEPITEELLRVLRTDDLVLKVTRGCPVAADAGNSKIEASWFVASKIHLNGRDEIAFVILPKKPCMNGANVGPFWIARQVAKNGYRLILDAGGLGLDVLSTKHNGYSDIEVRSATAASVSTVIFRFDGQTYRKFSAETESN